jgi:virulence factor Mce-like protein
MRRILTALLLVAVVGATVVATGASDADPGRKYWVELDNAFGLITGGDLKIAGVRAGKITDLEIDRKTKHALVGFTISETGFGSLRTDVRCESRPQSLIGEYFVDCLPGTARESLPEGQRIPVSQTSSTVAPDLVNNILRRPYKERLSIIINELGAAVAGNADNLNDAIARAHPALRETDKVLAILAKQNKILADLTVNADRVIGDLADNRKDVGRWVQEARDTARASAERRTDIALNFQRLPGFLRQLRPAMADLGRTADAQTPALQALGASAGQLERFFGNLKPFSEASRPAIRALGEASVTGSRAVKAARPTIDQLRAFASGAPELGGNLATVLEHLDDRGNAVENDPRSPNGQGYTGLEALLQYFYDQTMTTNIFDKNTHILNVSLFNDECAKYYDAEMLKKDPGVAKRCGSELGPNQPGINFPDITEREGKYVAAAQARARSRRIDGDPSLRAASPGVTPAPASGGGGAGAGSSPPASPLTTPVPAPALPSVPTPSAPTDQVDAITKALGLRAGNDASRRRTQTQLLDYLLMP